MTADGWYRTGDLATIDGDGYLRLTGRVKDIINRGGEKVPVAEIEQLLHEHPAVAEVAIVAMPDERLGERACAFVVRDPDFAGAFGLAEVREWLDATGDVEALLAGAGRDRSTRCPARRVERSRSSSCASGRRGSGRRSRT